MTIILTQAVRIAGTTQPIGTQLTLEGGAEGDLVHRGCATYVTDPHSGEGDTTVRATTNPLTGGIRLAFPDGSNRLMPYILAKSAIPMILCSSGSMGNNGAITGLTALPTTYADAYIYLPANAISAGSSAGLYYFVGSSTTAGTVYNNAYTSGVPTIPASPTAFVTTGPGAFAQSTSEITLQTITVLGGSMGANGELRCQNLMWSNNNSGTSKSLRARIASDLLSVTQPTTTTFSRNMVAFQNRGVVNKNVANPYQNYGATNSTMYTSINTAIDQSFTFTGQLAAATDFIVLEGYAIEVLPS